MEWLRLSGVVDPTGMQSVQTLFAKQPEMEATQLAQHLHETGHLTCWQQKQLLLGRYRDLILDDYLILKPIDEALAIYQGKSLSTGRVAALKILLPCFVGDESSRRRFKAEWTILKDLDQKHIVSAYHYGSTGKLHYYAMEYIWGGDLQLLVDNKHPLPPPQIAALLIDAAEALQYIHNKDIIHRDIKPANLMLDENWSVKLIDFGVAYLMGSDQFAKKQRYLGTPGYVAPEQVMDGKGVGPTADLYSLGGVLYFLLTGRAPFPEGKRIDRMLKHMYDQPEDLLTLRPDAPQALVSICLNLLQKDPEQRYQSGQEVAQALRHWLNHP